MSKFEFYLSKAIERKLTDKAKELNVNFSVNYNEKTDTSHLTISGSKENGGIFAEFASDVIIDNELSRTVKFKYI